MLQRKSAGNSAAIPSRRGISTDALEALRPGLLRERRGLSLTNPPPFLPSVKNVLIATLAIALLASLLFPRRTGETKKAPQQEEPVMAAPPKPVSRYAPVQTALGEASRTPGLQGSALGFCLIDGAGTVVVDLNAETAFIPASTLKTVTTATALQRLGPDFRFATRLRSTAPIVDGVLDGDVLIIGEGDPLLRLADLEKWAVTLKDQGLKEVTGRIVGDGRFFQGSLFDDFWNWGDIGNGYGSAVSGLNLEHNRFTVTFRGAEAEGEAALVSSIVPEVPAVIMVSEVTTGPAGSRDNVVVYGGEKTGRITMRGTVPAATETVITGAIPDPELFAAYHLRQALLEAGIAVQGPACGLTALEEDPLPCLGELLGHQSPPLLELITSIHATSDNHETECLFRKMGLLAGQAPDQVIREHWKAQGMEFIGLRMEDGCGLARADHIRPLDLARLQFLAAQGPHGAAWQGSLLSDGPVRSKGGAMSSIRSYTGYITSAGGEVFCFALMVNHYADSNAVAGLRRSLIGIISGL